MIDLHTHVLPGLDDGAADLPQSLEMLRLMAAEGVRVVAATPHVSSRYATTADEMEAALARVRAAAAEEDISIDLRGGAEIAVEQILALDERELSRLGLAGNPRALLVECPYSGWSSALTGVLEAIVSRGVWAVLAHPERNPVVQSSPQVLGPLVERGVLVQLTAASLDGRLGRSPARCAKALLDGRLAHMIASDAHGPEVRAGGLAAAVAAVDDHPLAEWLVADVPRAVADGESPPPRPRRRRRRSFR